MRSRSRRFWRGSSVGRRPSQALAGKQRAFLRASFDNATIGSLKSATAGLKDERRNGARIEPAKTVRARRRKPSAASAAYQVMTRLGFASESPYRGPIKLDGDPKGASVVILGAGLAGMTAAIELERAGYRVSVLEYNTRPGGRNWTIRGGDVFTELGGATQTCAFDPGLYINPGTVAHSLSSSRDPGLLPPVRRRARALHPAQSQRLSAFLERVRRQAAAHPGHQGRF